MPVNPEELMVLMCFEHVSIILSLSIGNKINLHIEHPWEKGQEITDADEVGDSTV